MSEHNLPEDHRNWPSDPFALLGVAHGASEMEIKRAYSRLIRKFKPEHAPVQFRLIRDAYESCLNSYRWYIGPIESTPDTPPPILKSPDAPKTTVNEASNDDPQPIMVPIEPAQPRAVPFRTAPSIDEADCLWLLAIEGKEEDAYAGLVSMSSSYPDRADIPLRLYWLLGLNPALDATRTRHHWLADALSRAHLESTASELYRRELEADPDAALYGPYVRLLDSSASVQQKLYIARSRLSAAGRTNAWHPIWIDWNILAEQNRINDEPGWLAYIVAILDWAAWERQPPLYERCRSELNQLRHQELSQSYFFDRVEETEHLAKTWRRAVQTLTVPGLLGLIPQAWAGAITPMAVERAVAPLFGDNGLSLDRIDRLVQLISQGLMDLLVRSLQEYLSSQGEQDATAFPHDVIRGLVRGFRGNWKVKYEDLRGDLLDFLIEEAIRPDEFASACCLDPKPSIRGAANHVASDASLRIAWLVHFIYSGN